MCVCAHLHIPHIRERAWIMPLRDFSNVVQEVRTPALQVHLPRPAWGGGRVFGLRVLECMHIGNMRVHRDGRLPAGSGVLGTLPFLSVPYDDEVSLSARVLSNGIVYRRNRSTCCGEIASWDLCSVCKQTNPRDAYHVTTTKKSTETRSTLSRHCPGHG